MQLVSKLIEPKQKLEQSRQIFTNKALFALIVPIIIEQLLALLVGIADTAMISYAGEAAVSGVSLVNQLNTLFILVFSALASGGAVVASQYVGRQDRENGVRTAGQLIMITTVISIVIMIIAIVFRSWLLHVLFGTVEADVMDACLTYLVLSAFSFPFLAVYNTCAGLFRSMNNTRVIMNVSIVSNAINVIGNAIGIFVLHAGVAGVAVPTIIARAFSGIVLLVLMCNKKNVLYVDVKEVFAWDGGILKKILNVAVPNGVENALFQLSKVVLSSIVALFGTSQIAANGVAQSFWSLAALFSTGMGYAFVTVIAQCMGAGDTDAADYYMKKLLRMSWLGGILWNALIFAVTPLAMNLYSLNAETIHIVIVLIAIHNVGNALLGPTFLGLPNGLRAAGDIRYTMFAAIFSTVIVRVVFSYLLGITLNMGVYGVAWAMIIDWAVKSVLIVLRYRSGKWKTKKVI